MSRVLLTLLGLAPLGCYTGLPADRSAGTPCMFDQDCGLGRCAAGVCVPPTDSGTSDLPGESDGGADGSSGGMGSGTTTTGGASATSGTSNTTTGGGASATTDGSSGASTSSGGGTDPSASGGSTATTDDTASGGTTGRGGSSGGPVECDPNDPNAMVNPAPGDQPGDPCCTTRDSCTGKDVHGNPAQQSDVGDQLECVGGIWVVDETSCQDKCESSGNSYLGCFWDSYYGLTAPLCGCQ